ncbi:hypothetical protein NX059_003688 [Plenodomus lindquistii]|nr:hypothetical protein NX059_003688 [Plenodomus lindquistii]
MDRHSDTNHTENLLGRGPTSPDRPPQLKLCGFRCGYGCEEPADDDGGGGESDAGSEATYVESNNEGEPRLQTHYGGRPNCGRLGEARTDVVVSERTGSEDEHLRELSEDSGEDGSGIASSMEVRSSASSDRSRAASAQGTVRMLTPGPGIGDWTNDPLRRVNRFPLAYYFLQTPLRLSPQYEHCRGDSLSHLIVPDRPLRPYTLEEFWIVSIVEPRGILAREIGV